MATGSRSRLVQAFRLVVFVVTTLLVVGATAVRYVGAALQESRESLRSDSRVRVDAGRWLGFFPEPPAPGDGALRPPGSPTGLILYPGGLVQPEAYAPVARKIAKAGHPVVIVPVTFRLAFFDIEAAEPVPAAFPDVAQWAVGGHSLGGVASAWYARAHPARIAGVVLWAAYTDDGHSLAGSTVPVLSVSGTLDGNVTPSRIAASRLTLPSSTRFVAIEGANHAQFGSYRYQLNDAVATISRQEQHRQVVEATVAFLDTLGVP